MLYTHKIKLSHYEIYHFDHVTHLFSGILQLFFRLKKNYVHIFIIEMEYAMLFLLKIYIHIFTIHLHSTEIYIKGNNKTFGVASLPHRLIQLKINYSCH